MGSVGIDQDLFLPDQISLWGGISSFHLNDLLLPSIKDLFLLNLSILYILSMPQVIEQSLFSFTYVHNIHVRFYYFFQGARSLSKPVDRPPVQDGPGDEVRKLK